MPKKKEPKIDGLCSADLKKIHSAVRRVWQWSKPWQIAKKRSVGADGFPRCENANCPQKGMPVAKVYIDHIDPVGEIGGADYITKMFIPSWKLQCLCKKCHAIKTAKERKKING